MLRLWRIGFVVLAITLVAAVPALAQDAPEGVVASGLDNPRHILVFGEEPVIYIVEAGTGGDEQVNGIYGPAMRGLTSGFTAINAEGSAVEVSGFPSQNEGGEVTGLAGIALINDQIWVSGRDGVDAGYVSVLDPDSGEILSQIDTLAVEIELNPDGDMIDSNPVDLAWDSTNGIVYIADAAANTVWKWTEANGLEVFVTWPGTENPVPTAVASTPDGTLYVGFLTGFPFPEGGSRVEHYDAEGTLVETFEGFTAITDLLFANDTLYAVEFARFGDTGWLPGTGRVVDVFSGEAYAENLNLPFGLTGSGVAPLVVTLGSAYSGPGAGVVVDLSIAEAYSGTMLADDGEGAADGADVPPPAATEEASG